MANKIEIYLRNEIKKRKGLALKFTSPGFTGVADRIVLLPNGIIVFVEIKNINEKLSARQTYVKKQFETLGFRVEIINSKEKVNNLLNELQTL